MNSFAEKKPVRHTVAGTIKTAGCSIIRGLDSWVVTCGGTFIGERDSYVEAESLASGHLASVKARVDRLQEERAMMRSDQQAEEMSEAQHLGIRCTGEDEYGDPTFD